MEVSKEEILHIAKLAKLKLKEEEISDYIKNLQDILNFANVVNKAPIEGLDTAISTIDNVNVFRKDEIEIFEDNEIRSIEEIHSEIYEELKKHI